MATTTTTAETSAPAVTSEEPSEQPPSEDEVVLNKLAEGIFGILGPSVAEIDDRVKEVRLATGSTKSFVHAFFDPKILNTRTLGVCRHN